MDPIKSAGCSNFASINRILFDLDGTLCDPREGIVRCFQYALHTLGYVRPPADQLVRYIGPPLYKSFAILLDSNDTTLINRAVELYRERFASTGMFENSLYSGIVDVLAALQVERRQLHFVTSKPTIFARQIIDHFGLQRFFQNVYGSELDGTRADKGELIAHVLDQEQFRPTDAVMIGDRAHDIRERLQTACGRSAHSGATVRARCLPAQALQLFARRQSP